MYISNFVQVFDEDFFGSFHPSSCADLLGVGCDCSLTHLDAVTADFDPTAYNSAQAMMDSLLALVNDDFEALPCFECVGTYAADIYGVMTSSQCTEGTSECGSLAQLAAYNFEQCLIGNFTTTTTSGALAWTMIAAILTLFM